MQKELAIKEAVELSQKENQKYLVVDAPENCLEIYNDNGYRAVTTEGFKNYLSRHQGFPSIVFVSH